MNATEWAAWIGCGTGLSSFLVNFARFADDRRTGVSVNADTEYDEDVDQYVLVVKAICRTKRPIVVLGPKWEFRYGFLKMKRELFSVGPSVCSRSGSLDGRLEDAGFCELKYRLEDWSEFQREYSGRPVHPSRVVFEKPGRSRFLLSGRRRFRGRLPSD